MFLFYFHQTAVCGGTYTGQSGTIKSPGYPDSNYPDESNCEWYLESPTGHYLTLSFTAFNLQSSTGCTSDYVEIREYNASGELHSTSNNMQQNIHYMYYTEILIRNMIFSRPPARKALWKQSAWTCGHRRQLCICEVCQ